MAEKILQLPSLKDRKRLIRVAAKTNQHYGKSPDDRNVKELLHNGFIILDKPSGPTSHQVVAWVKEILEVEKAGHGGTLDPAVTGVLPVALGDAARALQVILVAGKEYVALMKLHKQVDEKRIRDVCRGFVGDLPGSASPFRGETNQTDPPDLLSRDTGDPWDGSAVPCRVRSRDLYSDAVCGHWKETGGWRTASRASQNPRGNIL